MTTSKPTLNPVFKWKNGFSSSQSQSFIQNYNSKSFFLGDDIGTYAYLNLSEVVPVSKVYCNDKVASLNSISDKSIAEVKADGPLGKFTLNQVMHDTRSRMQAIIVMHKGKIVFEEYPGMPKNMNHVWMSATKIVTGLLIHMFEQEGLISLEKTVAEYIPELNGTAWDKIKLVDVLHQQTGLNIEELDREDPKSLVARAYKFALSPKGATSDTSLLEILKEAKQIKKPGTQFEYSTFNTQILGTIIEKVTKKRFARVFSERIWSIVGMEGDGELAISPAGESLNGGIFASRLRDFARFGLLFTPSYKVLTEQKIVDDKYFEKVYGSDNSSAFSKGYMGKRMIENFKETPSHASYQWDAVFDDGDLYKSGVNGQCLYVSPKNDIVVVWYSTVYYPSGVWLPIYARAIVKHLSK